MSSNRTRMSSSRRSRRADIARMERSAKKTLVVSGLLASAVAMAIAYLTLRPYSHDGPVRTITPAGGVVTIQLTELADDGATFFAADVSGDTRVRFFVTKSGDHYRAALDDCAPCSGQTGHHRHGSYLVCNKCGKRFRVDSFHNSSDECRPLLLRSEVSGGQLRIEAHELERVARKCIESDGGSSKGA